MGKRKRKADLNKTPPPPDLMPPSPGMDTLSKQQKFSHQVDRSGIKSFLTIAGDGPGKVTQGQQSSIVHRRNIDLLKSLRHPRHYGRHYSRRRSASNAEASTSHDEKLSLKMASKCYTDSGPDTENRQKTVHKTGGVPSSSLATRAISSDAGKLFCVLCQKFLKKEPYIVLENSLPTGETSVVAVLSCGHLYHADCLEQRTNHEDRHDPPCPICLDLVSNVDASVEQD
ncbi:uncharacterized protein LOC132603109 isoform X1 [Lycium barbarum]|uniref:uncharacterized protein LOC132603109 isoform X1 n=1 Tax=Lycium barbarum TaxID=112863 RepID=UPI00293F4A86|nr:uncharacterized protein LOC132603109 isoform X1 [Lycium barbarum]XP_060171987.1 uncharacterized protein LOC132603109 isoform X1 [Lycium barbarum]XP_060171988.1 uncharacterized protein LOC132603109 isoform X1 [Lycium barbarum]